MGQSLFAGSRARPAWADGQTGSAVQEAKLANYIVSGNQGAVNFTIRQMLKGIGQETLSPSQPSVPLRPAGNIATHTGRSLISP